MKWLVGYQLNTTPSLLRLVLRRYRPLGGRGRHRTVDQVVVLAKAHTRLHVGWVQGQQVHKLLGKLFIHLRQKVILE